MNMKKILICDDSALIRKKFTDSISQKSDITIIEAVNGEDCLNKYKEFTPDLVIMDIVMPVKSGLEALIDIKLINPQAKVIIASSTGTQEHLKKSIEAGAIDFIQKPINEDHILKIIHIVEESE